MSKKFQLLTVGIVMILSLLVVWRVSGQSSDGTKDSAKTSATQWEYLIVTGGNVNLTGVGSEMSKRKADGSFREATVVQRNLDKLGQQGWELVTVHGLPAEPIYYLKRAKEAR